LARVFKVGELDDLLNQHGFQRIGVDFAFLTFDGRGSRLGKILKPFRGLMRTLEELLLRRFGVSIVSCYQKM